jgi:iron complex transport system substrate-binding protein
MIFSHQVTKKQQIPPVVVLGLAISIAAFGCAKKRSPQGPIERVVTLTPTGTELVAAVGAADMLVGVDRFSDYPASVADLPKVGGFTDPSFEAIVKLRPDLVILDNVQSKVIDGLRSASIRTLVLDMHTVSDIREGLTSVGEALGHSARAAELVAEIDATVDRVSARRTADDVRPRVLLVIDREIGGLGNMVGAATGTYGDELLALLGAENVLADSGVRYPRLSAERILRAKPSVILDAVHNPGTESHLEDWNLLDSVPAVATDRVVALQDPAYFSPRPRVVKALTDLERILYVD